MMRIMRDIRLPIIVPATTLPSWPAKAQRLVPRQYRGSNVIRETLWPPNYASRVVRDEPN